MANTIKPNFRCDEEFWADAVAKAKKMRNEGYQVDMTFVLNRAVDDFMSETPEQIAERLGVEKADHPVPIRRQPYARRGDRVQA